MNGLVTLIQALFIRDCILIFTILQYKIVLKTTGAKERYLSPPESFYRSLQTGKKIDLL
jgi:hypothetical protein